MAMSTINNSPLKTSCHANHLDRPIRKRKKLKKLEWNNGKVQSCCINYEHSISKDSLPFTSMIVILCNLAVHLFW